MSALPVEEHPAWMVPNPPLRSLCLSGGAEQRALRPPSPRDINVALRPPDVILAEDDDLLSAHYEEVADFLPVSPSRPSLVTVRIRVAPEV